MTARNLLQEYATARGLELHRGMLVRVRGAEYRLCGLNGELLALKIPRSKYASVFVLPGEPGVELVPADVRRKARARAYRQPEVLIRAQARAAKERHLQWLRGRLPSQALEEDYARDFSAAPIAQRYPR